MLIALDFDGTYTADPTLWNGFVRSAQEAGHEVVCATMRHEHEGAEVIKSLPSVQVVFTGRQAKRAFLAEQGLFPAIWIDDNPAWIYQDAR